MKPISIDRIPDNVRDLLTRDFMFTEEQADGFWANCFMTVCPLGDKDTPLLTYERITNNAGYTIDTHLNSGELMVITVNDTAYWFLIGQSAFGKEQVH